MLRHPGPFSLTRRELLRGGISVAGAALLGPLVPDWIAGPASALAQPAKGAPDQFAQMRAQMGAIPITPVKLGERLTLLSGPGGNVVVLTGSDGKIVVDTFVQPAWDALTKAMQELGKEPVKALIDTHWHFDHTDNNAQFRKAGAAIVAHDNTKTRMAQSHQVLGATLPASPPEALPTQTFKATHSIDANGEQVALAYIPPAHTDTDITIRFAKANVIHLGDLFFNGLYPFIDASTGGKINGMIAASDSILKIVDANTKIVPGHGPLGDRAALTKYRDVMVTVRDRVQKLKTAGRTLDEVIAAGPSKEFDEAWGKGFMDPKTFVSIVYGTL